MTLAQLSITVALLGGLGLVAGRVGLSAIPAYLLAGLLLGPHEPKALSVVRPSEVTDFVAEIGLVFLLFFLGLEFTIGRIARSRGHVFLGGAIDVAVNGALGLVVGVAAFGFSFAAFILGAAIYVSSSAVTVKGLIDFRRLADDETDLVLAILVAEDLVIAVVLGFASGGGGAAAHTLAIVAKAIGFIAVALAISKWLSGPIDRFLDWLPLEIFLLSAFAFLVGSAALAEKLGLSVAVGALMAGVVLSGTSIREEIEERFFSFRDVFAALFFFVFGLSIDVGKLGSVAWLLALAVVGQPRGEDRRRLPERPARRLQPEAEPQRGSRPRRARRVHDHPRPAREREPANLGRDPGEDRRVRRLVRADHGHTRHRLDEGVEGDRPLALRRLEARCPSTCVRRGSPESGRSSRSASTAAAGWR